MQQLQLLFGELQLQLKWGQIRIFRLFRFLELQLIATKLQFIYPKIATKLQFLQDVKFDFSKNTIVQFFKDALKWGQKRIIRVFRFLELQLIATKLQFIGEKLQLNCNFSLTLNLTFLKLHLFSYLQYLL